MIKLPNIIIFIFILIVPFSWAYALSSEQKGSILERFKQRQYELLFESSLGDATSEFSDIIKVGKKINLYENIGDKARRDKEEIMEKNKLVLEKITSLEDSIKLLDEDINNTLLKVNKINETIINTKNQIKNNNRVIKELNTRIEENMEIMLEYMVYIYKKGNTAYDKDKIDNIKSILLNDENIGDVINDLYFKGLIQITGKNLIDKHRKYINKLYIQKLDLEKQEETLKKLRKMGIIEKKELDDKKVFKERILEVSKGQQIFYEKYVKDKIDLEKKLQIEKFKQKIKFNSIKDEMLKKYNCEYVDISINSDKSIGLNEKCLDINKLIYSESKLQSSDEEKINIFDWPIEPSKGISAYFRDASYKKILGSEHDAIDIVANQSTPIKAPADGYVIYIEKPLTNDYSYVAIKHYNGYITVYGHLNEVNVEQFDFVKKGDVFAYSGGQYGTKGAGYMTTGPHLHFEVYKDKQYIDPLTVLDTSFLSFNKLPEKYRFKYYSDFRSRKGYEYKDINENSITFRLVGVTEIERQKYLLSKYAIQPFKDWQMWVDEALDGNIDPSFAMCVGLAESTLGKYLKTPYNIGNVGNTDSGSTYSFPNARSGIYWMIKTFNNKYLGEYTSVSQLSRYGNKDPNKPIYASSSTNWHNNIIKCLSHLKGTYVHDDYNFRWIK
ncbi:MAG: peptidoglycan DD-metalloendopeptidase family protein [Candidatus Gracilibacteria bacterium]|nr:peptidoglycan DD-metalloendopeptidase family protein [Candidatus Gracilibacteria bacterium]